MLRSIRYGEADRVLHLYTRRPRAGGGGGQGGAAGAARGWGAAWSRSPREAGAARGPRGAVHGQPGGHRARPPGPARAPRLAGARHARPARRCCACSTPASPTRPPTTCCANQLALLDAEPGAATRAQALAFRAKLLLAAGFAPELASCASCGEREHLGALLAQRRRGGLRRLRGGLVPALDAEAHRFLVRGAGPPAGRGPRRAGPRSGPGRPRHGRDARAPRPRAACGGVASIASARPGKLESGRGGRRRQKLVYDFDEGSRDMRELLGGKGANVAEMTRVLGAERVPAGFTITTEACVAYMKAGRRCRRPRGAVPRRSSGWRSRPASSWATTTAAGVGALRARASRCPGCSTRSSTWGSTTSRWRAWRACHGQRALRLGLLPALRADVRQRLPRASGRAIEELIAERQARGGGEARHRALDVDDLKALTAASELYEGDREDFPAGPAGAAARRRSGRCSTPGWASGRWTTAASTASPTSGAPR